VATAGARPVPEERVHAAILRLFFVMCVQIQRLQNPRVMATGNTGEREFSFGILSCLVLLRV